MKTQQYAIHNDRLDLNPFTILSVGGGKVTVHRGVFFDAYRAKRIYPQISGCNLKHAWLDPDSPTLDVSEESNLIYFEISHDDKELFQDTEPVPINKIEIKVDSTMPEDTELLTHIRLATVNFVDIGDNGYQNLTFSYNLNSDIYTWVNGSPSSSSDVPDAGCVRLLQDLNIEFDEENCLILSKDYYDICIAGGTDITLTYVLTEYDKACLQNLGA